MKNQLLRVLIGIAISILNNIVLCETVMLQSKSLACQYIFHYQIVVNGESKVNLICIDVNTKYQKMYQIDTSGNVRFIMQYEDSKTTIATMNLRVFSQNKKSLDRYKKVYYMTREIKNSDAWGVANTSGELSYQASIEMQADIKDMLSEFYLTKMSNFDGSYPLCSASYTNCNLQSYYLQNEFLISIVKANSGSATAFIFNKRQIDNPGTASVFQEVSKDTKLQELTFCPNFIMITSSNAKQYFIVDGNLIENTFGQKFVKCVQLNSVEDTFALNIAGASYYLAVYDATQKKVNIKLLGDYASVSRIPGYNSALIVQGTTTTLYCNGSQNPLIALQNSPGAVFKGEDLEDLQQFYQGYFLANFKDHYRVIYEFVMDESTCTVSKFRQMNKMPRFTKPIFKDYDIFTPYNIFIVNRMCADEAYFKTTLIDNEYQNGCYYSIGRTSKQSDVFCNMQCRTCMPEDPNKCTSCFVEYEGQLDVATQTCKCPQGYYIESGAPLKCKPCINGCDQCVDGSSCQKCSSGRVLKNGVCDCVSPTYFNILKNDCVNLPDNCDSANYLGACTTCKPNYFLQNDACITGCSGFLLKNQFCVTNCPIGTFQNTAQKKCEDCNSLCNECTAIDICTSCKDNAKLEGKMCTLKCNSGSFTDPAETSSCLPCHQTCKTCNGPISSNCLSCSDGYYRFKSP